jgi:N-acetylglutamate synthase/N-acetylornithine aminotransferase
LFKCAVSGNDPNTGRLAGECQIFQKSVGKQNQ